MYKEAHLAGISPYVLRTANYYAQLGVGEYRPRGYHFDKVVVRVKEPFQMAEFISHSCSVLRVEFWNGSELQRYVDFVVAVAGFSGKPILTTT